MRLRLAGLPLTAAAQHSSGDEARYASRSYLGSFSKGLQHDALGLVDPAGYRAFLRALRTGAEADLSAIPSSFVRELVAGIVDLDFSYEGDDPTQCALPPAPALASATTAAETVELYWLALTRDVPFSRYADDPQIAAACAELAPIATAQMPRSHGTIGPAEVFRAPGAALAGPHLSQFYWIDVRCDPLGSAPQVMHFSLPGKDFLTGRDGYLAAQGAPSAHAAEREQKPAYLHSMRSLADVIGRTSSEAVFANAALFIAGLEPRALRPFFDSIVMRQLAASAQVLAGRAIFYQKFLVHRRVRPEAVGWLVDLSRRGHAMPLHESLLAAHAVAEAERRNGTALLPQVYGGGCPAHPSYPAAHGGIAGAVTTVFKAFVVDDYPWPNPVAANDDGSAVLPLRDLPLTLGGELDKLAANFALGRDGAGVHFRSDSLAGLQLGEQVALSVLRDCLGTMPSFGDELTVRRFDGRVVRLSATT